MDKTRPEAKIYFDLFHQIIVIFQNISSLRPLHWFWTQTSSKKIWYLATRGNRTAVIFTRSCSANYKITLNFAYSYFCSFDITLRYFTSLKLCNSFQFLQSSLKATSTSNIIKTNHYWHLHHLHLSACGRSNEQLSTPEVTREILGLTLPLHSLDKHQKQKR